MVHQDSLEVWAEDSREAWAVDSQVAWGVDSQVAAEVARCIFFPFCFHSDLKGVELRAVLSGRQVLHNQRAQDCIELR